MSLRSFTLTVMVLALVCSGVAGAATKYDPAVLAPIDTLLAAINTNKPAAIAAAYTKDAAIVDEFPPFRWSGPEAATTWYTDFGAFWACPGFPDSELSCIE